MKAGKRRSNPSRYIDTQNIFFRRVKLCRYERFGWRNEFKGKNGKFRVFEFQ